MDSAPRRRQWRRLWPAVRFAAGLALAGVAVYVVAGRRGELSGAASVLGHLQAGWVAVAVAAEAASIVAFAALQKALLSGGRLDIGLGPLTGITLAGNSINNSLPGGPAFASLFAYRQYRRRGADEALAGWTIVATGVCAALSLAGLTVIGLLAAGNKASRLNLTDVTLAVLGGSLVLAFAVWRTHRLAAVTGWAARLVERSAHLGGRRANSRSRQGEAGNAGAAGVGAAVVARVTRRLQEVRPNRRQVAAALGWSLANWACDCSCLVAAFVAVGSAVPWRGLLLAYGAGQLAANLPITPGGLGVVEGSLTIALVAYGGGQASTVAAVLIYRIISFWASLPVGWISWAVLVAEARARSGGERSGGRGGPDGRGGASRAQAVAA